MKRYKELKFEDILNRIKTFEKFNENDPYNEEIWDPEQHYIVTLRRKINMDRFIEKIEDDGFDVMQKWSFGVLHVRCNGKLEELKKYPEVLGVEIEKIGRVLKK